MPVKQLTKYLAKSGVKYDTIKHPTAYTAQQIAACAHISGKQYAKTVIVKLDGKFAMLVMPGDERVDLQELCEQVGCESATIANEYEFSNEFKDCETGAMPPFGNLYGMEVYVAKDLTKDKNIAFNAGTHTELIKMKYSDYEDLVKPTVINAMH